MIKGIFFATFDVNEGPKLHHLLPPLPANSTIPPLFDFRAFSSSLIPSPQLCNIPINILVPRIRPYQDCAHRILSHPVYIESETYPRNAFTFNFGLVISADEDFSSYLPVVRKLATLFRGLEERARFLSNEVVEVHADEGEDGDEGKDGGEDDGEGKAKYKGKSRGNDEGKHKDKYKDKDRKSKVYGILEILLEDLNAYGETQIPLPPPPFHETLNVKLFPTYPPPPPLQSWQVPLLTIPASTLVSDPGGHHVDDGPMTGGLDLTMARVLPYIDGVNSVSRIALLADADLKLVRKAIRHLLYYNCCLLLDIFSFGAIYAPTESIAKFVEDEDMQDECLNYVVLGDSAGKSSKQKIKVTREMLIQMYCSLSQSQNLRTWCFEYDGGSLNPAELLDLRRFITFGVIRGFLYRVHKYAVYSSVRGGNPFVSRHSQRRGRRKGGGLSTALGTDVAVSENTDEKDQMDESEERLKKYLDGTNSFDQICTEMAISERDLLNRFRSLTSISFENGANDVDGFAGNGGSSPAVDIKVSGQSVAGRSGRGVGEVSIIYR